MKNSLSILSLLLLLFSCSENKSTENTTEKKQTNIVQLDAAQKANAAIQNGKPEKRKLNSSFRVSGKIDVPPQNIVSVSIPLGGYLKSTDLLPGMRVKKGQVIATMEDKEYIRLQEEYLLAKIKLKTAEIEYNRQKELVAAKAVSDKTFQQTESEYNSLLVLKNSLAERLKLIRIDPSKINETSVSGTVNVYSTIDGYVSAVNVNIGKYVTPAEVLFELINPDDIHLNLKVFEKDLAKVAVGQKVHAWTNNQSKKYNGEIILVSQNLDSDRSAEVHCHFEKYDHSLMPGMFMNAEIETENTEAWTLPEEAIVMFEGNTYVFVNAGNDGYEMLPVKKGVAENGYAEIEFLDGRDPGLVNVVVKGAYALLMKLKNNQEEE